MTAKIIEFPLLLKVPASSSIHEFMDALSEQFEAMSPELQKEFQRRAQAAPTSHHFRLSEFGANFLEFFDSPDTGTAKGGS
jgi:hypothetical protein